MMTVEELIKQLQEYDPKSIVILAKDCEGNDFSPLEQIDERFYIADSTWSGEAIHKEDIVDRDDDENAIDCVVLWPIN